MTAEVKALKGVAKMVYDRQVAKQIYAPKKRPIKKGRVGKHP